MRKVSGNQASHSAWNELIKGPFGMANKFSVCEPSGFGTLNLAEWLIFIFIIKRWKGWTNSKRRKEKKTHAHKQQKKKWEGWKNNKMACTNASKWLYKRVWMKENLLKTCSLLYGLYAPWIPYELHNEWHWEWAMGGGRWGCQKKRRGLCPTSIINIESRASTSNEKCANKCGWIVGDGVENVLGACRMGEWVFPLTLEHVCSMAFHAHTPFDIKIKMAMGPSSLGHD